MLTPDENLQITAEDIETADSCRDESGFLHRFVLRESVGKWKFSYAYLTGEEYAYMEDLFAGRDTFQFTYPDLHGAQKTITAYRKQYSIMWKSAADSQYHNYIFTVVGC